MKVLAGALAAGMSLSMFAAVPAGATAPPSAASTAAESLLDSLDSAASGSLSAKKKPKRKAVFVTTPDTHVDEGGQVHLHAAVTPRKKAKVTFEEKAGGSWQRIKTEKTSKKGHAKATWTPKSVGKYQVRALAGKTKSSPIEVQVNHAPTPPGPTPPPPTPVVTGVAATWPTDNPLEVDKDYPVQVTVTPALAVNVTIQQQVGGDWQDLAFGAAATTADGSGKAILNLPDPGDATLRVKVQGVDVATGPTTVTVTDAGDTLYNVPRNLPAEPGVVVKAQEFPLTYPKLPLKNPLDPTKDLIVPQIGDPAAGPPTCMTDAKVARADCKVPGKQYRIMYTDRRWVPDSNGGGQVQGGTVAATAMVIVPDKVAPDAPVFAWAHPTLGQANQCSITRGVDPIKGGVIGKPDAFGPGGVDINLTDMSFFLDSLLKQGYVVVMPDYLGIAVNGPTGAQKTYVVGPQEARDLFYAVKSLHTPADPSIKWPGVAGVGKKFVAAGHSQGGHAAMWAGIEADELGPETGMELVGVIAAAPATDINQIVNTQWSSQVNWVLGPEVIQTYLGYMPQFAMENNILTPQAMQDLPELFNECTTQTFNSTAKYYPNGIHSPGTPFMVDPAKNQEMFMRWGKILGAMTPTMQQGLPNSFPKDMPLQLISGQADDIVVSQIQAAMQEQFCSGGAQMNVYWSAVATGAVNAKDAKEPSMFQAANHLNILNYTWTNDIGGKKRIPAGALLQFTKDRFAGAPVDVNCSKPQQTHMSATPGKDVASWYVFPKVSLAGKIELDKATTYETSGSPLLMPPAIGNPMPALGSVDTSNISKISQTGCGFTYVNVNAGTMKLAKFESNPACTQWGMWPWGEWVYPTAGPGNGWGKYPLEMAMVTGTPTAGASKVLVDVNPNRAKKNYRVKIQVKSGTSWKTVKKTRTKGKSDRVTVNVPTGTYRVELPAQFRHQKYRSEVLTIKR